MGKVLNGHVVALMFIALSFMIVNNVWNNNLSLFLTQSKLGNSNTAGVISIIFQLGGLLSGLSMGWMAKIARNYLLGSAFTLSGLSLLLLAYSPNVTISFFAAFLNGFSMSLYFAQGPFLMTLLVPAVLIPMGSALLNAAGGIGGFIEPIAINGLNNTIFDSSAKGALIIGAILALIIAVVIYTTQFQKKCLTKTHRNPLEKVQPTETN